MTGKNALKLYRYNNDPKLLDEIEEDLEVLEILKEVIEDDFGYFKLKDQFICIDTSVHLSKEKYEKMREWLNIKNDK